MHYAMRLTHMSNMELIDEFERVMLFKCIATQSEYKEKYSNQIECIKDEIKRRMR